MKNRTETITNKKISLAEAEEIQRDCHNVRSLYIFSLCKAVLLTPLRTAHTAIHELATIFSKTEPGIQKQAIKK